MKIIVLRKKENRFSPSDSTHSLRHLSDKRRRLRASNCEHLFRTMRERERESNAHTMAIDFRSSRAENIFFMAFQGQMLPFSRTQYLDLKVIHAISSDCVIERARFHSRFHVEPLKLFLTPRKFKNRHFSMPSRNLLASICQTKSHKTHLATAYNLPVIIAHFMCLFIGN